MAEQQTSSSGGAPKKCTRGCGFFGSDAFNGMCSKCYKEWKASQAAAGGAPASVAIASTATLAASPGSPSPQPHAHAQQQPSASATASVLTPTAAAASVVAPPVASSSSPSASAVVAAAAGTSGTASAVEPAAAAKPVQTERNRCWKCKKAIGLNGFDCKCGYVFCAKHRHAEKHKCDFDFKADAQKALEGQNPQMRDRHHFTRMDSMDSV